MQATDRLFINTSFKVFLSVSATAETIEFGVRGRIGLKRYSDILSEDGSKLNDG